MMSVSESLKGVTRLAVDTSPIIYFLEEHEKYDRVVAPVFQKIAEGSVLGFSSVISLCEVLVQPMKKGDSKLQASYRELLLESKNFELLLVDSQISESAAGLRVRYNLRPPDAIQLSTALSAGCEAILTNDQSMKRVKELRVLVLDDLSL